MEENQDNRKNDQNHKNPQNYENCKSFKNRFSNFIFIKLKIVDIKKNSIYNNIEN